MQFAGQRTDMDLQPVDAPINLLITLTPDVLPQPDAVLLTGVTPQQTLAQGVTEAEFLRIFYEEVVQPDTIFTGYNSIRFDDEFMRFLHYRNFYDAYEWQWKNGCSKWDILDVVRMTRALRPAGIDWPFAPDGKPANRLEFLTKLNHLDHAQAHDALSDVLATIAVARLIRDKQPDLFKYLLGMRHKKEVARLVEQPDKPFVYTSGRYPSTYLHTTAAVYLTAHPQSDAALVYDLRQDPTPFSKMHASELAAAWRYTKDPEALRLPVKTMKYNRCPAVAPLGVIKDSATQARLALPVDVVAKHLAILHKHQAVLAKRVIEAVALLDDERTKAQTSLVDNQITVDDRLYEKFIDNGDKNVMAAVRAAQPETLTKLADKFHDERLQSLLPLYKARNYPRSLSDEERAEWEHFCRQKLFTGGPDSRLARYFARLSELAETKLTGEQKYLLEELQLYGQSIVPPDGDPITP